MLARVHHQQNVSKLLKIDVLPGLERVLDEEWNDALKQVLDPSDPISHPRGVVDWHHAAAEMLFRGIEDLHIAFVLHDGEFRQYLISGCRVAGGIDAHVKTTFTVHEACDRRRVHLQWPFANLKSLSGPV